MARKPNPNSSQLQIKPKTPEQKEAIKWFNETVLKDRFSGQEQLFLEVVTIAKQYYKSRVFCGFSGCNHMVVGKAVYLPKNLEVELCSVHLRLARDNVGMWRL